MIEIVFCCDSCAVKSGFIVAEFKDIERDKKFLESFDKWYVGDVVLCPICHDKEKAREQND